MMAVIKYHFLLIYIILPPKVFWALKTPHGSILTNNQYSVHPLEDIWYMEVTMEGLLVI